MLFDFLILVFELTFHQGSAISMPWVDSVKAILHSWYLGNEVGNAIADILYGTVNPSGKLPLSFPKSEEDIAAFPHFQSENGKIYYHEDVFVGYRHHTARGIKPLFAFG
jgi:beta-glucosidase